MHARPAGEFVSQSRPHREPLLYAGREDRDGVVQPGGVVRHVDQ
jgi:hypothetical protein